MFSRTTQTNQNLQSHFIDLMTNKNGGNVGIGSSNPSSLLDISDGTDHIFINAATIQSPRSSGPTYFAASSVGGHIDFVTNGRLVNNANSNLVLKADQNSYFNGNVGVGAESPGSKFQVNGNAAIGYSTVTAGPVNGLAVSGNVGIGTTAPSATLDVESASTDATTMTLGNSSGTHQYQLAVTGSAHSYGSGYLTFWDQTVGATRMIVSPAGNVGIGTTAPTQRLDLGGGNISVGYEIITSATCTTSTGGWASCTATCPAGKQALGGSCGTGCCTRAAEYTTITSTSYTSGIYQTNGAYGFNATVVCANIK